jgi:hypothetical protein
VTSRGSALVRVEDALAERGRVVRNGKARCPAHDDRTPSLSVKQGDAGALVHCHAGCDLSAILEALDLEKPDLFDEPRYRKRSREPREKRTRKPNGSAEPFRVALYEYVDRNSELLGRKVRYEPKSFRWEVPDETGGWRTALEGEGNPGVLYRLPEVFEADEVHVGEGEKAADALVAAGYAATCPPTGTWPEVFSGFLRGKRVTIWQDRDETGEKFARKVYDALRGVAASVRVVQSADTSPKADAFDHLAAGFSVDQADPVDLDAHRLRVLTPEEFEADVAPPAIVDTMIYAASTHAQTGASKAGKTWAALQLAMAVAAGKPFLGLEVVAAPVLYLSLELSAGMLRGRMREIEAGTGVSRPTIGDMFHVVAPTAGYVPSLDIGKDEGAADLERLIRETGTRLAVLDTLYRFIPGTDPIDNGEMGVIYGRLNDLAQRTGAALLILDHVGKGEQLGPVSHSALGASVKGGAARVVIALRRTSREDGGRWQLDVESHFGSWEEPLYYERPRLPDGTRGGGCVLCTASEAHGIRFETLRRLFIDHGDRDDAGHPFFASKRKLREALLEAKLAGGNFRGDEMVAAIMRDYCVPEYAKARHLDRPVLTKDAERNALVFTWRMAEPESEEVV